MATEKTPPLLSMLQRLPPSKELLDFYHKKLEQYVDDEQRWLKRLASTKKAVDQSMNLEKEVFAQKREITALQKAVTDMREALAQERKINNNRQCRKNIHLHHLTFSQSPPCFQTPSNQIWASGF